MTPEATPKPKEGPSNGSPSNDTVVVSCKECAKSWRVFTSAATRSIKCPVCHARFVIPPSKSSGAENRSSNGENAPPAPAKSEGPAWPFQLGCLVNIAFTIAAILLSRKLGLSFYVGALVTAAGLFVLSYLLKAVLSIFPSTKQRAEDWVEVLAPGMIFAGLAWGFAYGAMNWSHWEKHIPIPGIGTITEETTWRGGPIVAALIGGVIGGIIAFGLFRLLRNKGKPGT